jgi:hypothetical protein
MTHHSYHHSNHHVPHAARRNSSSTIARRTALLRDLVLQEDGSKVLP